MVHFQLSANFILRTGHKIFDILFSNKFGMTTLLIGRQTNKECYKKPTRHYSVGRGQQRAHEIELHECLETHEMTKLKARNVKAQFYIKSRANEFRVSFNWGVPYKMLHFILTPDFLLT